MQDCCVGIEFELGKNATFFSGRLVAQNLTGGVCVTGKDDVVKDFLLVMVFDVDLVVCTIDLTDRCVWSHGAQWHLVRDGLDVSHCTFLYRQPRWTIDNLQEMVVVEESDECESREIE